MRAIVISVLLASLLSIAEALGYRSFSINGAFVPGAVVTVALGDANLSNVRVVNNAAIPVDVSANGMHVFTAVSSGASTFYCDSCMSSGSNNIFIFNSLTGALAARFQAAPVGTFNTLTLSGTGTNVSVASLVQDPPMDAACLFTVGTWLEASVYASLANASSLSCVVPSTNLAAYSALVPVSVPISLTVAGSGPHGLLLPGRGALAVESSPFWSNAMVLESPAAFYVGAELAVAGIFVTAPAFFYACTFWLPRTGITVNTAFMPSQSFASVVCLVPSALLNNGTLGDEVVLVNVTQQIANGTVENIVSALPYIGGSNPSFKLVAKPAKPDATFWTPLATGLIVGGGVLLLVLCFGCYRYSRRPDSADGGSVQSEARQSRSALLQHQQRQQAGDI